MLAVCQGGARWLRRGSAGKRRSGLFSRVGKEAAGLDAGAERGMRDAGCREKRDGRLFFGQKGKKMSSFLREKVLAGRRRRAPLLAPGQRPFGCFLRPVRPVWTRLLRELFSNTKDRIGSRASEAPRFCLQAACNPIERRCGQYRASKSRYSAAGRAFYKLATFRLRPWLRTM